MNEIPSYEELLQRCLDRVPNTMDKRQGSIIYDALAPACVELAQMYITLSGVYDLVFIDSSVGSSLDALVKQNGLTRKNATKSLRKGEFNKEIPLGSRFSDGDNSYIVKELISGFDYLLESETAGSIGNEYYGSLTPISYVLGLTKAELTDVIEMGNDKETDEQLRIRYMETVTAPQFGGNISDYQNKVKELIGVGGCKVIPIWDGGGTVKLIITNSVGGVPTGGLINDVQEAIDPQGDQKGLGIAPIGHVVTVEGAVASNLAISATFVMEADISAGDIKPDANEVVDNYFSYLSSIWDKEENLIVRISQIETRLLGISGVIDVSGVKINGSSSNLTLEENKIPLRNGDVVVNV